MSNSPLMKKLHIKPGHRILLINAPDGYLELLGPLPEGAEFVDKPGKDLDFVQLFVRSIADLNKLAPRAIKAVKYDGLLWIAYPKKSSKKIKSDISRDVGWDTVTKAGLDGVASIAIDDDWTAIRLRPVRRPE
jgi:hypothetical protein